MTKRIPVLLMASLLFLSPVILADDAKPATEPAAAVAAPVATPAAEPAKPADAVGPVEAAKPAAAAAAEPLPVEGNEGEYIKALVKAFNAKDWGIFAGLALMILVWVLKKFIWKTLPVGVLPWVSAGAGVAVAVATGLFTGLIWWRAILNGLTVGAAASGLWSMVGKKIFGKNEPESAEEEKASA